eukprot:5091373-Amphidinium_carterae.2
MIAGHKAPSEEASWQEDASNIFLKRPSVMQNQSRMEQMVDPQRPAGTHEIANGTEGGIKGTLAHIWI